MPLALVLARCLLPARCQLRAMSPAGLPALEASCPPPSSLAGVPHKPIRRCPPARLPARLQLMPSFDLKPNLSIKMLISLLACVKGGPPGAPSGAAGR